MRTFIRQTIVRAALVAGLVGITGMAAVPAYAQSEASATLSMMPIASVIIGSGVSAAGAGAVVAVPAALSVGGAVLVVKSVEASAKGTVYLVERASDGAQASIEVVGRGTKAVSVGVGTALECSLITGGVILSAAGAVVAFIPDAVGEALLFNERL